MARALPQICLVLSTASAAAAASAQSPAHSSALQRCSQARHTICILLRSWLGLLCQLLLLLLLLHAGRLGRRRPLHEALEQLILLLLLLLRHGAGCVWLPLLPLLLDDRAEVGQHLLLLLQRPLQYLLAVLGVHFGQHLLVGWAEALHRSNGYRRLRPVSPTAFHPRETPAGPAAR